MKTILFLLLFSSSLFGQNPFVGSYQGTYNNDNIYLTLQNPSGNTITGKMKDSQQNYTITATSNGSKIDGKAVENSLNLTFVLNGMLNGNQLDMQMVLDYNGQKAQLDVVLFKQGVVSSSQNTSANALKTKINFPAGATHDSKLVGKWAKNESYSSGYGDNYMSGNFQQNLILFADGTVGDGGSSASVSGGNYYGNSQGGAKALEGVYWYNIDNQLYLYASKNGQTETAHLGRYYIENGAMLITAANGKKTLLYKK